MTTKSTKKQSHTYIKKSVTIGDQNGHTLKSLDDNQEYKETKPHTYKKISIWDQNGHTLKYTIGNN